jgi:two-component system, NarL family, sensor kinase
MLHPRLDDMRFPAALRAYADGFSKRSGIALEVSLPADLPLLSSENEAALLRIVQEALDNIHRHSASRKADIAVTLNDRALQLEIAADGRGIAARDLAALADRTGAHGVGLRDMRERLHELHGSLEVLSDSRGTRIIATLPLTDSKTASTPPS